MRQFSTLVKAACSLIPQESGCFPFLLLPCLFFSRCRLSSAVAISFCLLHAGRHRAAICHPLVQRWHRRNPSLFAFVAECRPLRQRNVIPLGWSLPLVIHMSPGFLQLLLAVSQASTFLDSVWSIAHDGLLFHGETPGRVPGCFTVKHWLGRLAVSR